MCECYLIELQVHKENAPECLTMVHYTELTEKGIILMRGEYDKVIQTTRRKIRHKMFLLLCPKYSY